MSIPFFFAAEINSNEHFITLDEDNSRHAVSVLRMKEGEPLYLTDGKGALVTASISDAHKKKCRLAITGIEQTPQPAPFTAIGISLLKNPVRFEWFLEKATEIGITTIYPLLCQRTEKQHVRTSRLQHVLVSALLQSRQTWMPVLHAPITTEQLLTTVSYKQQFIAHCMDGEKQPLASLVDPLQDRLLLIGPEGDFTPAELDAAVQHKYLPVALGATRLRTETAGVAGAVLLKSL